MGARVNINVDEEGRVVRILGHARARYVPMQIRSVEEYLRSSR